LEIKDLRDKMTKLDVEGEIVEVSDPRTVNVQGADTEIAEARLQDKTGTVKVTLWGDQQIGQVKVGSRIRISNGYTKTFKGEMGLNIGRYGKLEVWDPGEDRPSYYRTKINAVLGSVKQEALNHDELAAFTTAIKAFAADE